MTFDNLMWFFAGWMFGALMSSLLAALVISAKRGAEIMQEDDEGPKTPYPSSRTAQVIYLGSK